MIPVLSVSQMRAIDEKAIGGDIAAGYSYMLKAGLGLFEAIQKMAPDKRAGEIAVFCGKGNNGGDGFIISRLLLEADYHVMCFGLCPPSELQREAKLAFDHYIARKGNFLLLDDYADLCNLSRYFLIVDALLGTGISGNPRGLFAEIIEAINQSGVPVLSVDTPSGLDNDRGVPGSPCIKAKKTVAMGFPKIGAFFYPGKSSVGEYFIKDLGYPEELIDGQHPNLFLPTLKTVKKLVPPRKPSGSKFDHGLVACLCGSRGMTGSAALASMAALRTGCGMVHLFSPKSAVAPLSSKLLEVVLHEIDETTAGTPGLSAFDAIMRSIDTMQALCIGPGVSHEDETAKLVRQLVTAARCPIVLDADGINAYKGNVSALANRKSRLVITPHRGEWERLFPPLSASPIDSVRTLLETATQYEMTILHKGSPTIVAGPGNVAYLLPYGNSGMATAGCGDVLSGIIASLIAQGCGVTDAAALGAYIHGLAGEAASETFGEHSMIASDLLSAVPAVMKTLIV